jgi:hypothetical protein
MRVCMLTTIGLASCLAACGGSSTRGNGDDGIASASIGDGTESASGDDASTSGASASSASGASNGSDTDAATTDNDDDGPKFDLGTQPDGGPIGPCGGSGSGAGCDFSYIWIANSSQNTISKINTQTLVEEGRYRVRPDGQGSPSRTSVNTAGDVAVASRQGGITKVYARTESCIDQNGDGIIQTSSGANDVLAWEAEECRAWYTAFPGVTTQRPVAWTQGEFNQATCAWENQKVWTAGGVSNSPGTARVFRLDGNDGAIEVDLPIPEIPLGTFGPYGAAVNSKGDLWFINYDTPRRLVHVDYETLAYTVTDVPANECSYGFTVDSKDRPWIGTFCGSGTLRFTPGANTFDAVPGVFGYGIQEDANGTMWLATFSPAGLQAIDADTLAVGPHIALPTFSSRGVSIDFEGYVWFVDMTNSAFKVDTTAGTWDTYDQLVGPYTYSDMTGWGLCNVTAPPG